jgi:NitT/TauT family transport system substrate-binding protein
MAYRLVLVLLVLPMVLAACGGDDDDDADTGTDTDTVTATTGSGADATSAGTDEPTEATDESPEATTGSEGSPEASGEPTFDLSGVDIRMTGADPEALAMTSVYMADLLRGWGAEVEEIVLTSTTGVQALLAGQTELAGQGADELILGAAEGADLVAFASPRAKMDYVLVTSNEITSVEDLAGKSVGMSGPAGFDTLLTRVAVREAGMDVADVNFVQIGGSGDRAAALLAGRVDAVTIFLSDWIELSKRTDDLQDLLYMAELVPDFTKDVIFAERDFYEENQDLALAVACANLEAFAWFHADKQTWVDYVLERVDGSTEEATSELYDLLVEIDMYPQDPSQVLLVEGMQGLVDTMVENGDISETVEAASLIDRSQLEAAAAMGCGQ